MTRDSEPSPAGAPPGRSALASIVAGALIAALIMVVAGWLLLAAGRVVGRPDAASGYRTFLASGGWAWFPLWGAALGAIRGAIGAASGRGRIGLLALAVGLAVLPLAYRPEVREPEDRPPATPQAKARAVLRWSYRSPENVLRIVAISRDPDPRVREQAVLALGRNRIVTDIEHATALRPATLLDSPVRDSLRLRLIDALGDPVEAVRAEAARALWNAPRTFGPQPPAAETLAAVLDRAAAGGRIERLSWLALDAAAGVPDSALKSAAARFAATTADTALRRRAIQASQWP
jgi:hypothetical protein